MKSQVSRRTVVKGAAALIGCSAAPALQAPSARAAWAAASGQTSATAAGHRGVWGLLQRAGVDVAGGALRGGQGLRDAGAVRAGGRGNFTLCRMPIGANDFARDWYSYDEVDGDFALEHFSIANDLETLVPFILNPDGSTVIVIQNDLVEPLPVRIRLGGTTVMPTLPADSFSTLVVKAPPGSGAR